jgi:hypothetical protein
MCSGFNLGISLTKIKKPDEFLQKSPVFSCSSCRAVTFFEQQNYSLSLTFYFFSTAKKNKKMPRYMKKPENLRLFLKTVNSLSLTFYFFSTAKKSNKKMPRYMKKPEN